MDKKAEVLDALGNWVLHVTAKKAAATSVEIETLPKVAELFLNFTQINIEVSNVEKDTVSSIAKELKKAMNNL